MSGNSSRWLSADGTPVRPVLACERLARTPRPRGRTRRSCPDFPSGRSTDRQREPHLACGSLGHRVFAPIGDPSFEEFGQFLPAADEQRDHRSGRLHDLNAGGRDECPISQDTLDREAEFDDAAKHQLGCVGSGFVAAYPGTRKDEGLIPRDDECRTVAMARTGAITWGSVVCSVAERWCCPW